MILLNLTSPTKPAAAPPPPLRKGVVVQQTLAVPAEPLRHLWCSGAAGHFPGRLLQNGCAGRRSRLKIQAGCRPTRRTLPDPRDVDAPRCANSTAGSAPTVSAANGFKWGPAISAYIKENKLNCVVRSEEAELSTPDFDDEWFHSGNAISAYIKEDLPNCLAKSAEDDLRMSPLNGWEDIML